MIIIALMAVLIYWYYQKNIDVNDSYMIPYNAINKEEKTFSIKSVKIRGDLFIKHRYTSGISKGNITDKEWISKIKSIFKEIDIPADFKKEIIKKSEKSLSITVGSSKNGNSVKYKFNAWNDFDKNANDIGFKIEWDPDNPKSITKRDYKCETDITGEIINKQVIKYSTYDLNIYNILTELITEIINSPLRDEISSPVIIYAKGDVDAVSFRFDDYNAKVQQISKYILLISEYLKRGKDIKEWLKDDGDSMLSALTFGFDFDKKFYITIHYYSFK